MKKSKFSDAQIMDALKRAKAGMKVPESVSKRRAEAITDRFREPVPFLR